MTDFSENTPKINSLFPETFAQAGSDIDVEISIRLSRSMWRALAATDEAMRARLNTCLQDEIDGLLLQGEIDGNDEDDRSVAVAGLLGQFLSETV